MTRSTRLPGTTTDSSDPIICHVDMDCFYAACERLREPALRGEPLVIGMGYEPGETHGAVATASYEAREFGVESAMAISEALERLPRKIDVAGTDYPVSAAGFYRPVDLEFYESVAGEVKAILQERAETVREVSIDEAYLDVAEQTDWERVESFAHSLKADIAAEVGVTASIGVAPTMSAAKVASDHDKPDGVVVVEPGEVRSFLAPLDVDDIHGVGPVTATELRELDIETAGDLAAADPTVLEARFGERGLRIHGFARGADDRPVEPQGRPKSFSRESAFTDATTDRERQRTRIQTLTQAVTERIRDRGVLYQTIGIKVVTPPFDVHTRARSLSGPVEEGDLVESVALELFEEFAGERVRKLGVRVSNLSFTDGQQPSLDAWESVEGKESESVTRQEEQAVSADGVQDGSEVDSSDGQRSLTEFE